jgi:hypothetical protein
MMRTKILLLKFYRIAEDKERRLFGDFRVDLKDFFRPETIEIQKFEVRAKMANKPTITCSVGVYYKTDPPPPSLSSLSRSTIQLVAPPLQPDAHVMMLVEDRGRAESDSDNFDEDIISQSLQLVAKLSTAPTIDEFVLRSWYDFSKAKLGFPGFLLAQHLTKLDGQELLDAMVRTHSLLGDVCSTIREPGGGIGYFTSCLCLYQKLGKSGRPLEIARDICYGAIAKACSLVTPELQRIFMRSLGVHDYGPHIAQFRMVISKFKGPALTFLLQRVINDLDCVLSNSTVTQHAFNTLTLVLDANSAITSFETAFKVGLPIFRQVVLSVISHESILEDPDATDALVPLVPPAFIYFLLCIIKPDVHLPEAIGYRGIEAFAQRKNVNFKQNPSVDLMFKASQPDLPPSCPEFDFT